MKPKHVKGVTALWPLELPKHVAVEGPLDGRVIDIAERLRARFRPAKSN